jgi:hypothetical protein
MEDILIIGYGASDPATIYNSQDGSCSGGINIQWPVVYVTAPADAFDACQAINLAFTEFAATIYGYNLPNVYLCVS